MTTTTDFPGAEVTPDENRNAVRTVVKWGKRTKGATVVDVIDLCDMLGLTSTAIDEARRL